MTGPAVPVAIVGAGLAGLVAARELCRRGIPVRVYEAGRQVAGLARIFRDDDGFVFDYGAHFITNRLAAALGVSDRCRVVRRYGEAVVHRGHAYGYPFGLIRSPRFVTSAAVGRLRSGMGRRAAPASAAEWYRRMYGRSLADEVAIPLVEAWTGAPADELAPSVIPPQVDRGTAHVLRLKLASRLTGRAVANGYSREMPESVHVWHVYPEGSLALLCERLADEVGDAVRLESPVEAIVVESNQAVGVRVGGRFEPASSVVSTAPVHILARLVQGTDALKHLARFRYRPMVMVNLRMQGRELLPDVVTWVPDRSVPFFRITEAPRSMPWLAPAGKTLLTVDLGCEVGDGIWSMADDALGELCVEHLGALLPDARRRYLGCRVLRTPIAHPVFLREYEEERRELERGLPVQRLHTIGRNGEFAHILMEDVYWRTLACMRKAFGPQPTTSARLNVLAATDRPGQRRLAVVALDDSLTQTSTLPGQVRSP
jgi:protoporphyrinogen/coproporphyrinogen III oxidase